MRNIGQNPTEADVEAILTQYDGDGMLEVQINHTIWNSYIPTSLNCLTHIRENMYCHGLQFL